MSEVFGARFTPGQRYEPAVDVDGAERRTARRRARRRSSGAPAHIEQRT